MKNPGTIVAFALFAALTAPMAALAGPQFYNTIDGTPLNFDDAMEEGRDTEAVKHFLETGENLYNEDPAIMPEAEELYAGMCSGCHGHYAEGKIGPGLNDSYWTYPSNDTDVGLFSTMFGGATGQMGPMTGSLTMDEMLKTMAWVRHLFTGDPKDAVWFDKEQQARFKPFVPPKSGSDDQS